LTWEEQRNSAADSLTVSFSSPVVQYFPHAPIRPQRLRRNGLHPECVAIGLPSMIRPCSRADAEHIHRVINDGAEAYRGVIPTDRWHVPYMLLSKLLQEMDRGVRLIGAALMDHLISSTRRPLLVGTWAAATWAVRFYERRGFTLVTPEEKDCLLDSYWSIPQRQRDTSVVLADERWRLKRAH